MHQVPDLAPERRANLAQLGKLDAAHAGFDPVVGEAVHAEQLRRLLLGQPERAATSAQGRSDVGLRRLPGPHQSKT